jgi:hypothetical protein
LSRVAWQDQSSDNLHRDAPRYYFHIIDPLAALPIIAAL